MRDIAGVNHYADADEEMMRIRANIKIPGDATRHLIEEMKQKYGKELAMDIIRKEIIHPEGLLTRQGGHD